MSWIATKYAWKCQNPLVKGSVRLVFLAIALRVEKHKMRTTPTSLGQIERLTLLDPRQIRRCLNVLCSKAVGEVERVTRGKRAVYGMLKLAGPLFVCEPDETDPPAFSLPKPATKKADNLSGFSPPVEPENADKMSGFPTRKSGQDVRKKADKMSGFPSVQVRTDLLDPVRTVDLSTCTTSTRKTAAEAAADESAADAATAAAVETFLDWFITEYPKHRGGILCQLEPADAEPIVRELVQTRSLERLQAMAIRMWAERQDEWVLQSDYSVRVLKHRAARYENQVIRSERRRANGTQSTRRERDHIAEAILKLERQPRDTPLGRVCAQAIDALQGGQAPGDDLDARLMAAARERCDLKAIEQEARAALAGYRERMTAVAYANALQMSIDRLIRERTDLPDLRELRLPRAHSTGAERAEAVG